MAKNPTPTTNTVRPMHAAEATERAEGLPITQSADDIGGSPIPNGPRTSRARTAHAAAVADAKTPIDVVVVRGVINHDGEKYQRGDTLTVSKADARRFVQMGLVNPADYVPPEEIQDGKFKITPEDGPNVSTGADVEA